MVPLPTSVRSNCNFQERVETLKGVAGFELSAAGAGARLLRLNLQLRSEGETQPSGSVPEKTFQTKNTTLNVCVLRGQNV